MKTSDLERELGLSKYTLRYYEKEGLITPQRDDNGYRHYSDEDLQTLKLVKFLRGLNMEKDKALEAALSQIERAFGKGSIMRLGQDTKIDIEAIAEDSFQFRSRKCSIRKTIVAISHTCSIFCNKC